MADLSLNLWLQYVPDYMLPHRQVNAHMYIPIYFNRAVATSQKDVETHLNGGYNLPPLVGIGLTDLPKRCGDVSPASLYYVLHPWVYNTLLVPPCVWCRNIIYTTLNPFKMLDAYMLGFMRLPMIPSKTKLTIEIHSMLSKIWIKGQTPDKRLLTYHRI